MISATRDSEESRPVPGTSCRRQRHSVVSAGRAGWACIAACALAVAGQAQERPKAVPKPQYASKGILVPAASADEPKVKEFNDASIRKAVQYLEDGALTWTRERSCVACHTTGVYLAERPALTPYFGPPSEEVRTAFVKSVPDTPPQAVVRNGVKVFPQVIYAVWRTLGLARWDQSVTGKLSDATRKSLRDMLLRQSDNGFWSPVGTVEIPYLTTEFELGLEAARAVAAAPGWLGAEESRDLLPRVDRLKKALREYKPRNDYERVSKLQLKAVMPDLVSREEVDVALGVLRRFQKADGGWSTRAMSATANWGDTITKENIAMIEAEPDAADPASDPYMTAYAVVVMREAGVPATDPRVQKGIAWLKANQRESGRWWMKSLYKNTAHYTTYIATAQALRALALCGEVPEPGDAGP